MNIGVAVPLLSFLVTITVSAEEEAVHESWTFIVRGGASTRTPKYLGADEYETNPKFGLKIDYNHLLGFKGCHLLDGAGSFYFNPIRQGPWNLVILLTGQRSGRDEKDAKALAGMVDRRAGMFGGIEVAFQTESFKACLEVHQGLKDKAGLLAGLNLETTFRFSRQLSLELGLTGVWGNQNYLNWEFGITALEAAQRRVLIEGGNEYLREKDANPFTTKSGLRGIDGSVTLQWLVTKRWMALASIQSGRLMGDAGKSPLTRSRNLTKGEIGLAYRFTAGH